VRRVAVHPAFRRRGIGQALIAALEGKARHGASRCSSLIPRSRRSLHRRCTAGAAIGTWAMSCWVAWSASSTRNICRRAGAGSTTRGRRARRALSRLALRAPRARADSCRQRPRRRRGPGRRPSPEP
jgi:ribosomal protein S18 acetylase RimI-like enzyme